MEGIKKHLKERGNRVYSHEGFYVEECFNADRDRYYRIYTPSGEMLTYFYWLSEAESFIFGFAYACELAKDGYNLKDFFKVEK